MGGVNRGAPKTEATSAVNQKPNRAGTGGRCCLLNVFICRGYKGHVPELSLVFGATGLDGGQLSLSSIAVISSSERLQLVFEGLTKPLAHKGAKVIHQGIVSSEEWCSLPRPGLPEIEARVDSVAATWMVCSGSVLRCLHCKMTRSVVVRHEALVLEQSGVRNTMGISETRYVIREELVLGEQH